VSKGYDKWGNNRRERRRNDRYVMQLVYASDCPEGCYSTVIVVSEQEPMNLSGRLCQVISWLLAGAGPGKIMTSVVNPASFQVDCA
jgi:hypothetical protein